MMKADLHVHSVRSDGSWRREAILAEAKRIGLTHLAFTEHDSTRYIDEGVFLGRLYGVEVIPALEISAFDFSKQKKTHILGYRFKTRHHIDALCRETLKLRHENGLRQIVILRKLGYKIKADDVLTLSGGGILYKQHILQYLYQTEQSENLFGKVYQEIFKNGGACDFDIDYVSAEDAVRAIIEDGGYAVLAHPGQKHNLAIAPRLAALGLKGIECNHPSNGENDRQEILRVCRKYNLFCTGGSDFHGDYEAGKGALGAETSPENPLISKVWHL